MGREAVLSPLIPSVSHRPLPPGFDLHSLHRAFQLRKDLTWGGWSQHFLFVRLVRLVWKHSSELGNWWNTWKFLETFKVAALCPSWQKSKRTFSLILYFDHPISLLELKLMEHNSHWVPPKVLEFTFVCHEPLAISHLEFSFSSLELVPTKIPLH